ncbi:MAG: FecR family protein [bacterium]|nr:FecR family protein [bacterium]
MLKRISILLCAVLILGAGLWGFWSLGNVTHASEDVEMTLNIEQDSVDVRHSGGEWESAENGMILRTDDEVRTGKNGRATVSFFGDAETTLRENTTIHLSDITADGVIHTEVGLISGRVWSRVIQLFDLGSTFSVRANDVVATVRGTAFDLLNENGETDLWVSESRVELTVGSEMNGTIIPEGSKMRRVKGGGWSRIQKMEEVDKSGDWFLRNQKADTAFHGRVIERAKRRLQGGGGNIPSVFGRVVELSEAVHLKMAKEDKPRLFSAFVGRRLFQIKKLIDDGKSGLALQDFSRLEKEIQAQMKGGNGEAYREGIVSVMSDMQAMLGEAKPSDPLFRLKQRVEDAQAELAGSDEMKQFIHQRAIESRMKETIMLMREGALEEASMSLSAAEGGIVNAERNLRSLNELSPDVKRALTSYLRALNVHVISLRDELITKSAEGQIDVQDEIRTPTSTEAVQSPTGTAVVPEDLPVIKPVVTTPPVIAPVEKVTIMLLRITPTDGITTVTAGGSVPMIVTAIYSNGTAKNVTPFVSWGSSNMTAGQVEGGVFVTTPNSFGSTTVTTSFTENGQTVGEAVVFTVNPPTLR